MKEKFDKVIIEMKSVQSSDDDTDKMELITEGRFAFEGLRYVIEYND